MVKGRIHIKGWSSWVRAETFIAKYQNWEVTWGLTKANFNAMLEAGDAKVQ